MKCPNWIVYTHVFLNCWRLSLTCTRVDDAERFIKSLAVWDLWAPHSSFTMATFIRAFPSQSKMTLCINLDMDRINVSVYDLQLKIWSIWLYTLTRFDGKTSILFIFPHLLQSFHHLFNLHSRLPLTFDFRYRESPSDPFKEDFCFLS